MWAPEDMVEVLPEVATTKASFVDFGVTDGVHVNCSGEKVELELGDSGA
jgi:hypothetical protein